MIVFKASDNELLNEVLEAVQRAWDRADIEMVRTLWSFLAKSYFPLSVLRKHSGFTLPEGKVTLYER